MCSHFHWPFFSSQSAPTGLGHPNRPRFSRRRAATLAPKHLQLHRLGEQAIAIQIGEKRGLELALGLARFDHGQDALLALRIGANI